MNATSNGRQLEPIVRAQPKTLEWEGSGDQVEARTPFGSYVCWESKRGACAQFNPAGTIFTVVADIRGGSLADAKAKAEKHWQSRVMACLRANAGNQRRA